MRAFTDGSGMEVLVSKDLGTRLKQPFRIGLDTVAGQVYWADRDSGLIQRANLDGSGVTTILKREYEKAPGDFRPTSPSGLVLNLTGETAPPPVDPTPPPSGGGDTGTPDLTGAINKIRLNAKNGSEQLEFQYTVENIGAGPVVGSYTIQVFLSTDAIADPTDIRLESWSGQGLGTGATETHKSKLDLSGFHANEYLLIVIDIGNAIAESDESNNVLGQQIVP